MKRRLFDRIAALEQSGRFVPQAPPTIAATTIDDIRATLRARGIEQEPNESMAETCARALGTPYADFKQLAAMGLTYTGLKCLLDLTQRT